jgi:hypothetical protein
LSVRVPDGFKILELVLCRFKEAHLIYFLSNRPVRHRQREPPGTGLGFDLRPATVAAPGKLNIIQDNQNIAVLHFMKKTGPG